MSTREICKRKLLLSEEDKENVSMAFYRLIDCKTYGYLKKPSAELLVLIAIVEKSIMKVLSTQGLKVNTLSEIMNELEQVSNLPLVGCRQHLYQFTKAILRYYIIIRMLFICRRESSIDGMNADKSRQLKKLSRLPLIKHIYIFVPNFLLFLKYYSFLSSKKYTYSRLPKTCTCFTHVKNETFSLNIDTRFDFFGFMSI